MATRRNATDHVATNQDWTDVEAEVYDPHDFDRGMLGDLDRVADAVAQALLDLRAEWSDDQAAMAARLSWMGVSTKPQTLRRIEAGTQPATLEQALALALLHPGGLRGILRSASGLRIGDTPLPSEDDLDGLLLGSKSTGRRSAVRDMQEFNAIYRNKTIAADLGVAEADVASAAESLYPGSSAHQEIADRTRRRSEQDDPPAAPRSPQWKAYRSHAVRQVTGEIRDYLNGGKQ